MFRQHLREAFPSMNIGSTERLLSTIASGVLLATAVQRGNPLIGVAGGMLAARGLVGYSPAYGLWNHYQDGRRRLTDRTPTEGGVTKDKVTLAAEQSFPASDPPSFTRGRA